MKKIKLLPPFMTFGAGAIASVLLYLFRCDFFTMLIILFVVLVVFYILGVVAMKIFMDCPPKEEPVKETQEEAEQEAAEEVKG